MIRGPHEGTDLPADFHTKIHCRENAGPAAPVKPFDTSPEPVNEPALHLTHSGPDLTATLSGPPLGRASPTPVQVVTLPLPIAQAVTQTVPLPLPAGAPRTEIDAVYSERAQLLAVLCTVFPASLERHTGTVWGEDFAWIVIVDFPTGQGSWHLAACDLPHFDHVPRLQGRTWDGHSTPEKYARLQQLTRGPQ